MKTDRQILDRISEINHLDISGAETQDLIEGLSYNAAKRYLKPETTEKEWNKSRLKTENAIKKKIKDYMPFAWEKANDCRGLSAMRSISHMSAWLFLLGMDRSANQIKEYNCYGKNRLRAICERFKWKWKQWDNGIWKDQESEEGIAPPDRVEPLLD